MERQPVDCQLLTSRCLEAVLPVSVDLVAEKTSGTCRERRRDHGRRPLSAKRQNVGHEKIELQWVEVLFLEHCCSLRCDRRLVQVPVKHAV